MKTIFKLYTDDVKRAIEQYLKTTKGIDKQMKITFEVHDSCNSPDQRENRPAGFGAAIVEVAD